MDQFTKEELKRALAEARKRCTCHHFNTSAGKIWDDGDDRKFWNDRIREQYQASVNFPEHERTHSVFQSAATREFNSTVRDMQNGVPQGRAYYPNGSRMTEAKRKY